MKYHGALTLEEWGRRVLADLDRRSAERLAGPARAEAHALARDIEKRARFSDGWNLLEQWARALEPRLSPASPAGLAHIDAHVLFACFTGALPVVSIRPICSFEDPALRAALVPCRDGRMLGVVLVPGDWQVRALRVATVAAPPLPSEALS
jgi:hypothetical protein